MKAQVSHWIRRRSWKAPRKTINYWRRYKVNSRASGLLCLIYCLQECIVLSRSFSPWLSSDTVSQLGSRKSLLIVTVVEIIRKNTTGLRVDHLRARGKKEQKVFRQEISSVKGGEWEKKWKKRVKVKRRWYCTRNLKPSDGKFSLGSEYYSSNILRLS